jgi:hypothetical protein
MRKIVIALASAMLFCVGVLFGCNPDHTPTITVNGAPGDVVIVNRTSIQAEPNCCSTAVGQGGSGFQVRQHGTYYH